ncbi:MAG: cysteine desulfurase family protein [Deltaproteobacteria bacterium]|nr:cysteine desulfurase family protein [Deltaproteobacteria bacterium]
MKRFYLDHNATTPVLPEALEAALPHLTRHFGNSSSFHWAGSVAREAVDTAREQVAALLCAAREEIIFTSGGTEGNNLALKGVLEAQGGERRHLVISAAEHASVFEAARHLEAQGARLTIVPVDGAGRVSAEAVAAAITPDTALVCIHHANNETGTLQPVEAIGRACRERGVPFHTDAVQAAGRIPLDLRALPVDLLSLSGHKMGGMKGAGVLYARAGAPLVRQTDGGPQERRRRAGTENVAALVALGVASRVALEALPTEPLRLCALRDRLWEGVRARVPDAVRSGDAAHCLPNTLNVRFPGADGETLLMGLDLEGVAASAGSACSTGSLEPSRVLLAMGLDRNEARASIRFSLGPESTDEDVERVIDLLPPLVAGAREAAQAAGGPEASRL